MEPDQPLSTPEEIFADEDIPLLNAVSVRRVLRRSSWDKIFSSNDKIVGILSLPVAVDLRCDNSCHTSTTEKEGIQLSSTMSLRSGGTVAGFMTLPKWLFKSSRVRSSEEFFLSKSMGMVLFSPRSMLINDHKPLTDELFFKKYLFFALMISCLTFALSDCIKPSYAIYRLPNVRSPNTSGRE